MADNGSNTTSSRRFSGKKQRRKVDFFTRLRSSGGFIIIMGLLITGTGMICFVPFRNLFSMLLLDAGLILSLFGFAVRLLDICLKLFWERV